MCNDGAVFEDYVNVENKHVRLADGDTVKVHGQGTVVLTTYVDGNKYVAKLNDVLYVPDLAASLLSVGRLMRVGYRTEFEDGMCRVVAKDGKTVAMGRIWKAGIIKLECDTHRAVVHQANAAISGVPDTIQLWHQRLGHLPYKTIREMAAKEIVQGLEKLSDDQDDEAFCEPCVHGKQHASPSGKPSTSRTEEALALVHSDVMGPVATEARNGYRYLVSFIDDYTRYAWVYPLKEKGEVFGKFKYFKTMIEKQVGKSIKVLRSDNGGEYTSVEFQQYLKEQGIIHQKTVPYNPQQNGVAERLNRTIMEMVRSMMLGAQLDQEFWVEAVATAVYLKNRSPHKVLREKTPYEMLNGRKPDLKHLKVFGCDAFILLPETQRSKLDAKSVKGIFVGYGEADGVKGYKVYDPELSKVVVSRDVIFNEKSFSCGSKSTDVEGNEPEMVELLPMEESEEEKPEAVGGTQSNTRRQADGARRSTRERRPVGEWWVAKAELVQDEPVTVQEAMESPNALEWKKAMNAELESIKKNEVYTLTKLPEGRKAIGSKWVFKVKRDAEGKVERFKARLVAKGYNQKEGIDYNETFAPVAKFNSIRTVLAIAAVRRYTVHQMDVKTAFLNGELEEEIYMEQPEGAEVSGKERLVWKLRKSLYGLKQAPRVWNEKLDAYLKEVGFRRCESDHSVYVNESLKVILLVYVDDLLIAGQLEGVLKTKEMLSSKFDMSDLGQVHWLLGMKVEVHPGGIRMSQQLYVEGVLKKFGMEDCHPVGTPLEGRLTEAKDLDEREKEEMENVPYRQAIGCLMYLMVGTRPDLAVAVSQVSRFMENPGPQHWQAVKHILRYLRGTASWCLNYSSEGKLDLVGYCDADWAGDQDTRRSTTGYTFVLGGASITWNCKRQPTVALSSTEAEYMAVCGAAKEAVWLRALLQEIGCEQEGATVLYVDNQGSIALAKNPVYHARTKHIDVQHHFIRNLVEERVIDLVYVHTSENVADVLTKPLAKAKHLKFVSEMGLGL
jgi:hypothetical protein